MSIDFSDTREAAKLLRDVANRLEGGKEILKHLDVSFGFDARPTEHGYVQNRPDETTTITMEIAKARPDDV